MDRRFFLTICAGALVSAAPAFAGTFEDAVIKQLKAQGFRRITVEKTLLGRVRIVSFSSGKRREIVLNPRTGEVLRDVLTAADGTVAPAIANTSGGSNDNSTGPDDSGAGGGSDDTSGSEDGGSDDNSGSGGGGDDSDDSGSGSDDSSDDDSGSEDSGSDDSGSDDGESDDSKDD